MVLEAKNYFLIEKNWVIIKTNKTPRGTIMTTIREETVKCGVCGAEVEVYNMASFSRFGGCDLDTRPPALFPFTIFLQSCSHCGYVDGDITEGDPSIKEFLGTEMYKTCDGIEPECEETKHFIQFALIQAHNKVATTWNNKQTNSNQTSIFYGFLNAAWSCDDVAEAADYEPEEYEEIEIKFDKEKAKRDAIACRKRCLDLIDILISDKKDLDEKETLMGIKADLLRRTGQFDEVIKQYSGKSFNNIYVDQIARVEVDLAKAQDTKRYNMGDIDQEKYPLKTATD